MDRMELLGTDFGTTGSVLNKKDLEMHRRKHGECVSCGRKCFHRKLMRLVPITKHGEVLKGRCLKCEPLGEKEGIQAVARPATREDLARFRGTSSMSLASSGYAGSSESSSRPSLARTTQTTITTRGSEREPERSSLYGSSHHMPTTLSSSHSTDTPVPTRGGLLLERNNLPPSHRSIISYRSTHSIDSEITTDSDDFDPHQQHRLSRTVSDDGVDVSSARLQRCETSRRNLMTSYGMVNESQRSAMSASSTRSGSNNSSEVANPPMQRVLNRGGAVTGVLPSTSSRRGGRRFESNRSLESFSSFGSKEEAPEPETAAAKQSRIEDEAKRFIRDTRRASVGVPATRRPPTMLGPHDDSSFESSAFSIPVTKFGTEPSASSALCLLSGNKPSKVEDIVATMTSFSESKQVQVLALDRLADYSFREDDAELLASLDLASVVLATGQRFAKNTDVQVVLCRALTRLCESAATEGLCTRDRGVVDAAVRLLEETKEPSLLAETLTLLECLARVATLAESLALAVPLVVEVLHQQADAVSIQTRGFQILQNLAIHTPEQVVCRGGVGAVVVSMALHQGDARVQQAGLKALCSMAKGDSVQEVGSVGGIDATIGAMQVHRDEAGVQEASAAALAALAICDENRVMIGNCGGVDVLLRAILVYASNLDVLESCFRGLMEVTADRASAGRVLDFGGLPAIIATMQSFTESALIQGKGCGILCHLALDRESKLRIVNEEALDAVVLSMVIHALDALVQEQACRALLNMCIAPNFEALYAQNTLELMEAAASNFGECGELWEQFAQRMESFASAMDESQKG